MDHQSNSLYMCSTILNGWEHIIHLIKFWILFKHKIKIKKRKKKKRRFMNSKVTAFQHLFFNFFFFITGNMNLMIHQSVSTYMYITSIILCWQYTVTERQYKNRPGPPQFHCHHRSSWCTCAWSPLCLSHNRMLDLMENKK